MSQDVTQVNVGNVYSSRADTKGVGDVGSGQTADFGNASSQDDAAAMGIGFMGVGMLAKGAKKAWNKIRGKDKVGDGAKKGAEQLKDTAKAQKAGAGKSLWSKGLRGASKLLRAGPLTAIVATVEAGTEAYQTEKTYSALDEAVKSGRLSEEEVEGANAERRRAHLDTGTKAVGGIGGALAGAKMGAAIGAFGGPIGAVVGGFVGAGAGWLAGKWAAQKATNLALGEASTEKTQEALAKAEQRRDSVTVSSYQYNTAGEPPLPTTNYTVTNVAHSAEAASNEAPAVYSQSESPHVAGPLPRPAFNASKGGAGVKTVSRAGAGMTG